MAAEMNVPPPLDPAVENPIAGWLRARGLKQAWLVQQTGWNSGAISMLVRGRRAPSIWTLALLYRVTGKTLDAGAVCEWYATHYRGRRSADRGGRRSQPRATKVA